MLKYLFSLNCLFLKLRNIEAFENINESTLAAFYGPPLILLDGDPKTFELCNEKNTPGGHEDILILIKFKDAKTADLYQIEADNKSDFFHIETCSIAVFEQKKKNSVYYLNGVFKKVDLINLEKNLNIERHTHNKIEQYSLIINHGNSGRPNLVINNLLVNTAAAVRFVLKLEPKCLDTSEGNTSFVLKTPPFVLSREKNGRLSFQEVKYQKTNGIEAIPVDIIGPVSLTCTDESTNLDTTHRNSHYNGNERINNNICKDKSYIEKTTCDETSTSLQTTEIYSSPVNSFKPTCDDWPHLLLGGILVVIILVILLFLILRATKSCEHID
ncbi:hypothetical protein CDIK_0725 [Cucumispora dikerogammari]|nr:hypothetical protein CDIK_0725 [Cucumispora dikerogammari]